jgi:predicted lipoprotein with Yx(FWY)xxD motif
MLARSLFIAALCLAFTGTAVAQTSPATPSVVKIATTGSSSILTGSNGMTLYSEDTDTNGKSMCNGTCAQNWPPLTAAPDAKPVGDFTVITRDDGTLQWAYKGKPLYFWKGDKQPGDTTGNGVAGRWHTAQSSPAS